MTKPRKSASPPVREASLEPREASRLLRSQYERGKQLIANRPLSDAAKTAWETNATEVLIRAFGSNSPNISSFQQVGYFDRYLNDGGEQVWEADRVKHTEERLLILEGSIELLDSLAGETTPISVAEAAVVGSRVFLVHGHDERALHEVARFLEKLELEVIVLREQPNQGRTIIEKFIDYSDVGFAVVLLTADDRGGTKNLQLDAMRFRARQNVILELGFFIGKLSRMRVCALYEEGVEVPSDYAGVLFVSLAEDWRLPLAKELRAAGLNIDMNKAV